MRERDSMGLAHLRPGVQRYVSLGPEFLDPLLRDPIKKLRETIKDLNDETSELSVDLDREADAFIEGIKTLAPEVNDN